MRVATMLAVGAVFVLALLDLRREEARALDDIIAEQATLARLSAATLSARLRGRAEPIGPRDALGPAAGPDHLISGDVVGASEVGATPARWLLMGARGGCWELALSLRDSPRACVGEGGPPPAAITDLLARMARGEAGALRLPREAAAALGLDRRMAVAGFAPIVESVSHGSPVGSVAVVVSERRVSDRARIAAWRLAVATGAAALLVALFGLLMARERELAEALRLSATTARLREQSIRAEKLATVGTLAAGVAHELGTPLGIISGRAEQLLTRLPGDGDGAPERKALMSIITQVEKVSTTIRQLLDFARVRPVEAQVVTPTQALESAAALLEHRFQRAKVQLAVDAPPGVPAVYADPGQLEQVLVNLLMNACDACSPGGHVWARAGLDESGQVRLEIGDDGAGIAREHLQQVLDPFFTTKKRGQGTGLGLTIVADIVKNHGGALDIESEPGRGTRVWVTLPAAAAKRGDDA